MCPGAAGKRIFQELVRALLIRAETDGMDGDWARVGIWQPLHLFGGRIASDRITWATEEFVR